MAKLPVLKISRIDIKQLEFQRFRDRTWLNDTLIYCFLKKYVQDVLTNFYCFGSHFFTRLREDGVYDYENVRRLGRKFSGVLAALKTLYVPIDISNTHWVFIKLMYKGNR